MAETWDPHTWRCDRCDALVDCTVRPYCLSHDEGGTLPPGWEAWDVCAACARASASQADSVWRRASGGRESG